MSNQTKRKGRKLSGVLLLDKPMGISSNAALQSIKRLFDAQKAGHTGSLDPLATGVLPICFGEATKFSQYLLDADKAYDVVAKLGQTTTTGDGEGEVIQQRTVKAAVFERLEAVLADFTGPIEQVPSMFSAIKHQGKPLYKLARKGIEVERKRRKIVIHEIRLNEIRDVELHMSVHCSKGTYIRSLVEDMGEALGCGAYVKALHRTQVGHYRQSEMHSLSELRTEKEKTEFEIIDGYLLSVDSPIHDWPGVNLTEDQVKYLQQGQIIGLPNTLPKGWVKLASRRLGFLGVGEIIDNNRLAPRRLLDVQSSCSQV